MKLKLLFLCLFASLFGFSQTQKAQYKITFTSVWNSTDHGTLPGNAHWSKLVGATHKTKGHFFEMGGMATPGVKRVAETGNNSDFNTEVNTAITANEAEQYIDGGQIATAAGEVSINTIDIDKDYPLVSLISMIAPSPDWIIAVNGAKLLDADNITWKDEIIIDLFAYDAGTDSGTSYTAANNSTTPVQPISSLKGVAPFNNEKIGTITIKLLQTLSTNTNKLANKFNVRYFNEKLHFDTIDNIKKIQIYDLKGQQITNLNTKQKSHDISSLAQGLYIINVSSDLGSFSKKIIKF